MTRKDASPDRLDGTKSLLGEVAEIFEEYEGAVIVGGNVPYLLIPQDTELHEGTLDIDVVVDPERLRGDPETTLHETLTRRLFQQDPIKPFRWTKGNTLVELLCGGTPTPDGHRRIVLEDVYASVIEGMEAALERPVTVESIEMGERPLKVASLPAFLAMKARALARRKSPKDTYDIVYCLRHCQGGIESLARDFALVLDAPSLLSGKEELARLFATRDSLGPEAYADHKGESEGRSLHVETADALIGDLLDRLP